MWKNRIGYGSILLILALLFFFSGRPFLLGILVLMLLLPVMMAVLLKRDAGQMQIEMKTKTGRKVGTKLPAEIRIHRKKNWYAVGSMQVEIRISNVMFGTEERRTLILEPVMSEKVYQMDLIPKLCGETVLHCESVVIYDLLKLCSVKVASFQEVRTVIYPEQISMDLELESRTNGSYSEDGMIQNRKGNDPSEMYDIREYVPGDDIRAIHWKLSSKTDELILRQPSAAMHYQVALMPDFGKNHKQTVTDQEWNTAAAALIAIGEELLKTGISFCLLIPENGELAVKEIRDRRMFRMVLSQWMGSPIQEHSIEGLRYFQIAHMEQYFTRLMMVTAGRDAMDFEIQLEQIRLICFIATEACQKMQVGKWKNSTLIEMPAAEEKKETWRVIC